MPQFDRQWQDFNSFQSCELCLDGLPIADDCEECDLAGRCDECIPCDGDCPDSSFTTIDTCCNDYASCCGETTEPCMLQDCAGFENHSHNQPYQAICCEDNYTFQDHLVHPNISKGLHAGHTAQNNSFISNHTDSPSFCRDNNCGVQHVDLPDFIPSHVSHGFMPNLPDESRARPLTVPFLPQRSSSDELANVTTPCEELGASSIDSFHCHWQDCDLSFLTSLQFDQHFIDEHFLPFSTLPDPPQQPLSCAWDQCQVAPHSAPALFDHVKQDHIRFEEHHRCKWLIGDGNHKISPCNMCFNSAEALTKHLSTEHVGSGRSNYICYWQDCDRCNRPFAQRQKIIRHIAIHTGNRPFVCHICGHTCSEEAVLKQHQRTHTGEKPFSCSICQKTFSASTALSVHMRTHTGFKPLVCKYPGCGKRFSESSNLTKHMKTHSRIKDYSCPCCTRIFHRLDQLKRHTNAVHGNKISPTQLLPQAEHTSIVMI